MRFCVLGARFPPLSGALFLSFSALVGCSTPASRAPLDGLRVPARIELADTPFFPQSSHQCGPAALATVLAASGTTAEPEFLADQMYLPARRGSLQIEMLVAARRSGAVGTLIEPSLPALLHSVAEGYPVAVLQNLGLNWIPRWHYAVVIGYDLDSHAVVLRSGVTGRLVMSIATFERTWSRSGRWGMVALRPGQLPSAVTQTDYLQAALAFEKLADPGSSLAAYEAAASRWPGDRLAWLGAGNSAYRLCDWPRAERAFAQAARLAGDAAPAFNNLALTLAAQGRHAEAVAAAERAVAAGGAFEAAARTTLEDLRASPVVSEPCPR
jgi:hypothetical protein